MSPHSIGAWDPEDVEPMIDSMNARGLTVEADLLAWVWRHWQATGEALNALNAVMAARSTGGDSDVR